MEREQTKEVVFDIFLNGIVDLLVDSLEKIQRVNGYMFTDETRNLVRNLVSKMIAVNRDVFCELDKTMVGLVKDIENGTVDDSMLLKLK